MPQAIDRAELSERARAPLSAVPRSFLRWAGAKRSLLSEIVGVLPGEINVYYEPFAGSAALYFLLQPQQARLSDACSELIETYRGTAADVNGVLNYLSNWKPDRDLFHSLRAEQPKDHIYGAARFIYLNKVCWNGLYRVNRQGDFNVPYGRPRSDFIIDASNLRACAALLSNANSHIERADFEDAVVGVGTGDLVFLDPPYVTTHNNNGFIEYNEKIFSWEDQRRLSSVASDLARRGAHVVVSNALHDDVIALYPNFTVRPVQRYSTIAGNKKRRGVVKEALIVSGATS